MSRIVLASIVVALSFTAPAWTGPIEEAPGQGTLRAQRGGQQPVELPLRRTEVHAEVSAFVARVEVTQVFANPFKEPIEAVYIFPLPERAAVDDLVIEVGDRVIRGEIKRREEAAGIYQAARAAGYTAALLQQERPNIFTQSVANIAPGGQVRVRLRYVELLAYADGSYRLLFPMVVGPRYTPGEAPVMQTGGHAVAAGAGQPPVLRPGFRSGHDISITVDLDAAVPIRSLTSESHRIETSDAGRGRSRIRLAPGDRFPNKDFMLRWGVAGTLPEVGVLAHRRDDEGFFALLVQPKAQVSAEEAAPKEIIFVLDESGSMSGPPIEMSKRFMRLALESLAPRDRFNIVRFAGSATVLAPAPLDNTATNIKLGLRAVDAMQGSGGTEMLAGFRAAMSQPRDPRCIRIIVFLTDGFIGNEEQIFELIRGERGEARIFSLGIGSSVNHYLLREMAELGHGAYQYVRPDGREAESVTRFQEWVTKPYLTDIEIDWGSLRVEDQQPARLPDLYSGQTLSLVGRYLWGGHETVVIRGRLGGVPWEKRVLVELPERSESHAALASVWARERIRDLTLRPGDAPRAEIEAEVTSLALAFRLMSAFTSFVAVDDTRVVNPGGNPSRVDQAVPIPEFVSFEGVFGKEGPAGFRVADDVPIPGNDDRAVRQMEHGAMGFEADAIEEMEVMTSAPALKSLGYVAGATAGQPAGMVHAARDTSLAARLPGTTPYRADAAGLPRTPSGGTGRRLEESALRVLADLADDGRLSRAEGLPALAGLLAAQGADGRFGDSARTQALATLALAQTAAVEPRLPWVKEAAIASAECLRRMQRAGALDPATARLTHLALASGPAGLLSVTAEARTRCLREIRDGAATGSSTRRLAERILAGRR